MNTKERYLIEIKEMQIKTAMKYSIQPAKKIKI